MSSPSSAPLQERRRRGRGSTSWLHQSSSDGYRDAESNSRDKLKPRRRSRSADRRRSQRCEQKEQHNDATQSRPRQHGHRKWKRKVNNQKSTYQSRGSPTADSIGVAGGCKEQGAVCREMKEQKKRKRRQRHRSAGGGSKSVSKSVDVMDEIMAELVKQRAKRRLEAEAKEKVLTEKEQKREESVSRLPEQHGLGEREHCSGDLQRSNEKSRIRVRVRNNSVRRSGISSQRKKYPEKVPPQCTSLSGDGESPTQSAAPPADLGEYRYDPDRRAYFPILLKQSDYCTQQLQKKPSTSKQPKQRNQTQNITTTRRIQLLRNDRLPLSFTKDSGITHPSKVWMQENLHAFQVCSSASRRRVLLSNVGSLAMSEGLRIVPTMRRVVVQTSGDALDDVQNVGSGISGGIETSNYCDGQVRSSRPCQDTSELAPSQWRPRHESVRWLSMLRPLPTPAEYSSRQERFSSVPLDCRCKTYLHPATRTFAIKDASSMASQADDAILPHIATIVDGGVHCRLPTIPREGFELGETRRVDRLRSQHVSIGGRTGERRGAGRSIHGRSRNFGLVPLLPGQRMRYGAIRFAPFQRQSSDTSIVGAVTCDAGLDGNTFTMSEANGISTGGRRFLDCTVVLPDTVNDFAFSPSTWGAPGRVAFATSASRSKASRSWNCRNPFFVDLHTMQLVNLTSTGHSPQSDVFCVEYLCRNNTIYGHRNGSVSVLDERSGVRCCIPNPCSGPESTSSSFGSVISVLPLASVNDVSPHLVLAKGSFGSCRLFDLRRLGSQSISAVGTPQHGSTSMLHQMTVPAHLINPTQSTRCAGLACDPSGEVAFAPFVSNDERPCVALWSLSTGSFVNAIPLTSQPNHTTKSCVSIQDIGRKPADAPVTLPFCELSSTITNAWDFEQGIGRNHLGRLSDKTFSSQERKGAWGLWFKCGSQVLANSIPVDGGGIHHMTIPGHPNQNKT